MEIFYVHWECIETNTIIFIKSYIRGRFSSISLKINILIHLSSIKISDNTPLTELSYNLFLHMHSEF